jgi:hypothetical protein
MVNGQSASITGNKNESGTAGVPVKPQTPGDTLGEAGFPGAQRPGEQINITRGGFLANDFPNPAGFVSLVSVD